MEVSDNSDQACVDLINTKQWEQAVKRRTTHLSVRTLDLDPTPMHATQLSVPALHGGGWGGLSDGHVMLRPCACLGGAESTAEGVEESAPVTQCMLKQCNSQSG